MYLRWFISAAWRQALAARRHYRRLLRARRDELSPEAGAAVRAALEALNMAMVERKTGELRGKIEALRGAAGEWITPYPHPLGRAYLEVLLLAMVLALGIRTFFAEPFRIPTDSMEPTLCGVNYYNLVNQPGVRAPGAGERWLAWFAGVTYLHVVAPADGVIENVEPVTMFLGFNLKQTFTLGGVEQVVWFPPDLGDPGRGITHLLERPAWVTRRYYHKGEDVISLLRREGDFMLADRLTYNFRPPARGEIVVFRTAGIAPVLRKRYGISADEYYLKRLVGLPGERVQIGNAHHLIINGRRLTAADPHFGGVLNFDPRLPLRGQSYGGYLNGWVAQRYRLSPGFAPLFPDQRTVFADPPGQCLLMGDNTVDSLDSRYWGSLSEDAIVGKCWLVFWPLTERFGWRNR